MIPLACCKEERFHQQQRTVSWKAFSQNICFVNLVAAVAVAAKNFVLTLDCNVLYIGDTKRRVVACHNNNCLSFVTQRVGSQKQHICECVRSWYHSHWLTSG